MDKIVIGKLVNIPINRSTLTPNKIETITSIIIVTIATSRSTSITKEISMIIPINNSTTTSIQKLTPTAYNGYIKTVIGNSVEIEINTTTSITIRINSVLIVFVDQSKQII